ncbi:DUF3073 domain-containing protein [Cellulomonas bogoriensis]|uniref:DUF3073 domain-containing protein n=1 Tax=Cellulomonas bogoriensis 69B4 = DSM 16987 TaxID=1386082 RepID=A0A0A0C2I8_9CELL|nr:DUF3073 domain-containing protein [Cellulomonas bogoriensis]KGM14192.1 hypothetical protein N869_02945 [Cellulomonas bogoriensis 69B4 = DSM 16987]
MGRGRQKAKQTKVARALKYSSYEPNYKALEQELTSGARRSDLVTENPHGSGDHDDDLRDWSPDDR